MGWKRKKLEAMNDEDLVDAYLVGKDGGEVPCCKAIMATTSPVFKRMFFRGPQNKERHTLTFHSLIVSVVVKYCYSGEVDMDLICSSNKSPQEEATLLLQLRDAGKHFEIEDVASAAETKIGKALVDVHLEGTDGTGVPCCKAILGTKSQVFKRMFFRGPIAQKRKRFNLNFHSLVISLIVKYCYTEEVDVDLIFSKNKSMQDEASLLLQLRGAGRYFELEALTSSAEAKIGNLVFQKNNDTKKYQYASAYLTELCKRDEDTEPFGSALYYFAVENTIECFGPRALENDNNAATYAHPRVLSNVLQFNKDVYAAVQCIQTWFSLYAKSTGKSYSGDNNCLTEMAAKIDLKALSTRQLSNIKPCSLFSNERILEAFVHHCKSSESITAKPRTEPRLFFSGAGMKNLNGAYVQVKRYGVPRNIFSRRVKHSGKTYKSIIHRKHTKNKWLVSIMNDECIRLTSENDVEESSIQLHVYESPSQALSTEDLKLPPFSGWKCVEGTTGPVPFVAWSLSAKAD